MALPSRLGLFPTPPTNPALKRWAVVSRPVGLDGHPLPEDHRVDGGLAACDVPSRRSKPAVRRVISVA
jgi:hypothetical protein